MKLKLISQLYLIVTPAALSYALQQVLNSNDSNPNDQERGYSDLQRRGHQNEPLKFELYDDEYTRNYGFTSRPFFPSR